MCGGHGSFRLCGGLPRGFAVLGDRRPSFQQCLAAWHTRAKGSAQAVKNLTFVAVPHLKRNTSRRPPSALTVCNSRAVDPQTPDDEYARSNSFANASKGRTGTQSQPGGVC